MKLTHTGYNGLTGLFISLYTESRILLGEFLKTHSEFVKVFLSFGLYRGNIPKEFIPSIQKGFQAAMKNGVLAGFPVEHLKVTLIDGSFHPVDSDQLSFELCAIQAFKKASEKANPVLLEPIMKIEVVTPEESMGDVIGDLNKRRGQVEGAPVAFTVFTIFSADLSSKL